MLSNRFLLNQLSLEIKSFWGPKLRPQLPCQGYIGGRWSKKTKKVCSLIHWVETKGWYWRMRVSSSESTWRGLSVEGGLCHHPWALRCLSPPSRSSHCLPRRLRLLLRCHWLLLRSSRHSRCWRVSRHPHHDRSLCSCCGWPEQTWTW